MKSKIYHNYQLVMNNNEGDFESFLTHDEAQEYFGCEYIHNQKKIIQRTAKITPKKIGQFVTLWKRCLKSKETMPFNENDEIDFVLIICCDKDKIGHFLFPKYLLIEKGIISNSTRSKGKRGFRVYPKWDRPESKQAIKSQNWQLEYFFEGTKIRLEEL